MISVQVSIDLPLFQKNRQNRELAAKLALVEQARDLREDAIRQHLAEAQAASADWDAATSRLKRFDESLLPLSQQRGEAALAAYRGGRGDLMPVLQARRDGWISSCNSCSSPGRSRPGLCPAALLLLPPRPSSGATF
jgi:outer membrane protein TolC